MVVPVVDEDRGDAEDKPEEAGSCATRVDTAKVLENGGAPEAELERRPFGEEGVDNKI